MGCRLRTRQAFLSKSLVRLVVERQRPTRDFKDRIDHDAIGELG